MDRARSISIEEVTKAAHQAAEEVLAGRMEQFGPRPDIGVFPDIGTVGLIWRDPPFERFEPKEMLAISQKMTEVMGPGIVGEARACAKIFDGGITMGYFPIDPEFMANFK